MGDSALSFHRRMWVARNRECAGELCKGGLSEWNFHNGVLLAWRAGCQSTDSVGHIVQGCHQIHLGRIKWHDQICRIAASALSCPLMWRRSKVSRVRYAILRRQSGFVNEFSHLIVCLKFITNTIQANELSKLKIVQTSKYEFLII